MKRQASSSWCRLGSPRTLSLLALLLFFVACQVNMDPGQAGFPCNEDGSCDVGLVCTNGVCLVDECEGVECLDGEICVGGECYSSNCDEECGPGQICMNDECVDIGCSDDDCADGTICNGGICVEGCRIDGAFYSSLQDNQTNSCEHCQPEFATNSWTQKAVGASCSGDVYCIVDMLCDEDGDCVGGEDRDCSHLDDECLVGICDENRAGCFSEALPAGTPCEDNGSCDEEGECRSLKRCLLPWGGSIEHGGSVTAYSNSAVPYGGTCDSVMEERHCNDGVLSGSFRFQTCDEADPNDCVLPWGGILANGSSRTAWRNQVEPYGGQCQSELRTCTTGNLSGSYEYEDCVVGDPGDCDLPWGGTISHGHNVVAYETETVAFGSSCNEERRHCTNGSLSGSYGYENCQPADGASCSLPWGGGSINHNEHVRAYQEPVVPYGATCVHEDRLCNNGTLQGSYIHETCAPDPCADTWRINVGGASKSAVAVDGGSVFVAGTASDKGWLGRLSTCDGASEAIRDVEVDSSPQHPDVAPVSTFLRDIQVHGANVYVGGDYSRVADSHVGIGAAYDKATLNVGYATGLFGSNESDELWAIGIGQDSSYWLGGASSLESGPHPWMVQGSASGGLCGFMAHTSRGLIRAMIPIGNGVLATGSFDGHVRVLRFDTSTCVSDPQCKCDPTMVGQAIAIRSGYNEARAIARWENTVYVGGFASDDPDSGNYEAFVARVNLSDGSLISVKTWSPTNYSDMVTGLSTDGQRVYASVTTDAVPGQFSTGSAHVMAFPMSFSSWTDPLWSSNLSFMSRAIHVAAEDGAQGGVFVVGRSSVNGWVARCTKQGACPH